jgi:hypothetical protein
MLVEIEVGSACLKLNCQGRGISSSSSGCPMLGCNLVQSIIPKSDDFLTGIQYSLDS